MQLIDVNEGNVIETGFFCKMSQRKNEGWRRKLGWLQARFAEGMKMKMLDLAEGGRGFIEYIPGKYAWRPVHADGYMFIHCLWVVGKSKGKGYAGMLLDECVADARRQGMKGVAMVTSEGNWLIGKQLLLGRGFDVVDQASPSFSLLVRKFGRAASPSFPDDWDARAARFKRGLSVVRSDQCPYLDDAVNIAAETADERGLKLNVVELASARDIQERAPSPYGVFSILLDGKMLGHYYLLKKDLVQRLDERLSV